MAVLGSWIVLVIESAIDSHRWSVMNRSDHWEDNSDAASIDTSDAFAEESLGQCCGVCVIYPCVITQVGTDASDKLERVGDH